MLRSGRQPSRAENNVTEDESMEGAEKAKHLSVSSNVTPSQGGLPRSSSAPKTAENGNLG